jgi:hypothetical protein
MQLEKFESYMLKRPVKATSIPSYIASLKAVENALGGEIDTLLASGKSSLIDKVQISNPKFAGKSDKKLSDFRCSVRRYAEATGVK